ncbi:MAG: hypothetical protein U9Q83_09090, partial [Bacteroidota bacterium]|nr:hypothetical protein [Bacteroidota bacterium]
MQPYNANNKYHVAEKFMLSFLHDEISIYDNWKINFAKKYFTNSFPLEKVIENINQTEKNYWNYNDNNNFTHPISLYFNRFIGEMLFGLQTIKRNSVDGYNAENCVSDAFSNNNYNYYKVQTNRLIWDFNSFNYACNAKNIYLLNYPNQTHEFIINKKQTAYTEKEIVFTAQKFIPYLFQTSIDKCSDFRIKKYNNVNSPYQINSPNIQTNPISELTAKALNNYLDYINKIIDITHQRAMYFRTLNKNINKKLNEDFSNIEDNKIKYLKTTADYKSAISLYYKTINNSRFIPQKYIKSLNAQAEAIMIISAERRQLPAKINSNLQTKAFINDSFATIYKHIQRFDTLWNEFDLRIQILYYDILTIYNSYPKIEDNNSWIVSGNVLNSVSNENKILLFDVKNYLLSNVEVSKTDNKLRTAIRQTLLDEYENMDGIKKIGRYHGHCPYSYYEDIAEDSRYVASKFVEYKQKSQDTLKISIYNSHLFLRRYKDIIRDYNKFVWLAEGNYDEGRYIDPKIYLLKNIFQADIFKFQAPKIIDPRDS